MGLLLALLLQHVHNCTVDVVGGTEQLLTKRLVLLVSLGARALDGDVTTRRIGLPEELNECHELGESVPTKIDECDNFADPQTKYLTTKVSWVQSLSLSQL